MQIREDTVAKARVLLVEDEPLQAKMTKELLEKAGYEVLLANDGISAIRAVKTGNPDIILMDIVLPGLNGFEICRWLKQDDSAKGIPIIMLTARTELGGKVSALQIGADDYLPKPYDALELNARIYASLRTKLFQDELRMKNRQLEELLGKVEYMAITDALTGLYNRRRFYDFLAKEFKRSKRYSTALSLAILDVDYFKKVNDTFGHQTGDKVLKEISDILLKSIREIDTAARYGGEEFVVILPNTGKEGAIIVAERIRGCVEKHEFTGISGMITISAGISSLPDDLIGSEEEMLKCADIALYSAKSGGRNRTESAEGADLKKIS
jgi:diguanylate cyclase (GGDEF)-like protein